jgi:hypothetical protein
MEKLIDLTQILKTGLTNKEVKNYFEDNFINVWKWWRVE